MKKETEQAELFQQKWGSDIVDIDRQTQNGNYSINPIVKSPIGGV
jgi:hypothetical protein